MAKHKQDFEAKCQDMSNDVSRLQLEKEALARTVRLEMSEKVSTQHAHVTPLLLLTQY